MKKRVIAIVTVLALILCGCSSQGTTDETPDGATTSSNQSAVTGTMDFTFTDRDLAGTYKTAEAVDISGSADMTITKEGVYLLTGTITDTMITIAAGDSDKVQLVLNNVTIENSTGPAIYIQSADKVFITAPAGTVNTISDGTSYEYTDGDTNVDGAIFSKADLTINGSGGLTVKGNNKHGIVSKDDLVICDTTLSVSAENVGMDGKDCVKVSSATCSIAAGTDGIRSSNEEDADRGYVYLASGEMNIYAGKDGIQAATVIRAEDIKLAIATGSGSETSLSDSGESYKGMKAASDIVITGGSYSINSTDDAIHSNGNITISGGVFDLASGDDGIHADTDLTISDGDITVTKSYEGVEATNILISGGRVILTASDDGINAAGGMDSSSMGGRPGQGMFSGSTGTVTISGGYIWMDAAGDGVDSNGTLEISGGITLVCGPTNSANAAIDYETSSNITGGVLVALGASGMAQMVNSDTQGIIGCSFSNVTGSFILCDSAGNVVVSLNNDKSYSSAIVTAPDLNVGESYTVVIGGEASEADELGYADSGTYTGGTALGSLDADTYSSSDNYGTPGGHGGNPGGQGGRPGR